MAEQDQYPALQKILKDTVQLSTEQTGLYLKIYQVPAKSQGARPVSENDPKKPDSSRAELRLTSVKPSTAPSMGIGVPRAELRTGSDEPVQQQPLRPPRSALRAALLEREIRGQGFQGTGFGSAALFVPNSTEDILFRINPDNLDHEIEMFGKFVQKTREGLKAKGSNSREIVRIFNQFSGEVQNKLERARKAIASGKETEMIESAIGTLMKNLEIKIKELGNGAPDQKKVIEDVLNEVRRESFVMAELSTSAEEEMAAMEPIISRFLARHERLQKNRDTEAEASRLVAKVLQENPDASTDEIIKETLYSINKH